MGAADAPMLEDDEDLAAHMSVRGLTGVRSGLVPNIGIVTFRLDTSSVRFLTLICCVWSH